MIPKLPCASEGRTIVIGIDGFGGSGKTTYANDIQQRKKGTVLLHLDDFIYPKKVRYTNEHEEWYCYYHVQWRYEYLIQHLLHPLRNGQAVNEMIEFYDKESDRYVEKQLDIPIGTTVIIEGVFLQRPLLKKYLDYVIFLDVDKATRLERVIERDAYIGSEKEIIQKYEQRYFPAEELYMTECQPLSMADFIQR